MGLIISLILTDFLGLVVGELVSANLVLNLPFGTKKMPISIKIAL